MASSEQTLFEFLLPKAIIEVFGQKVEILNVQRLHGGMVHHVLLLETTAEPFRVVAKVSSKAADPFVAEGAALTYLSRETAFPVPEVYGKVSVDGQHALFIEFIPGINMGAVALTGKQQADVEVQLAELLIELHKHTADTYRDISRTRTSDDWWPVLEGRIQHWFAAISDKLHPLSKTTIPPLLKAAPPLFSSPGGPTLVHGDIWETNVMLQQAGDSYQIAAFVDPSSEYVDVEWELAYLEVFSTVSDVFWKRYRSVYPERPGYEARKLYYWLNTMLLHVEHFGNQRYIDRTEQIVRTMQRLIL